jgi:hypothetical protein
VWFGDRPDMSSPARLNIATASLLTLNGRHLAVTCDHVVAAFRELRHDHPAAVFGIGGLEVDLDSDLIDRDKELDLAVIDIAGHVKRGTLQQAEFHEPASWPTSAVQKGAFVCLAGFPGVWVEQPGFAHLRFHSFTSVSEVHSVAESHFYARLELDKCETDGEPARCFEGLGGVSGGPVFVWRTLHAELVGFVVEYQADYDLLYIRRSDVVSEAGLRAS